MELVQRRSEEAYRRTVATVSLQWWAVAPIVGAAFTKISPAVYRLGRSGA